MNNIIDVSIIIPIYNSRETLRETIESVLNQSHRDIELILVDDGSNDGSEKICDYYARKDNRVVVIHKKNSGISDSRNKGLEIARGNYVGFLDHDDMMRKDLIKDNYHLALKYDADLVKFEHEDSDKIEKNFFDASVQNFPYEVIVGETIQKNYIKLIGEGHLILVWDKLFKKSFLERYKLYFDNFFLNGNDDIDFCMRIFPCLNSLVISQGIYYLHILYKTSTSGKFSDEKIKGTLELISRERKMLLSLKINLCKNKFWNQRIESYLLSLIKKFKNKSSQATKEDIEKILYELRCDLYYTHQMHNKEKIFNKQILYIFLFRNNYIKIMVFFVILSRTFNKIFNR